MKFLLMVVSNPGLKRNVSGVCESYTMWTLVCITLYDASLTSMDIVIATLLPTWQQIR